MQLFERKVMQWFGFREAKNKVSRILRIFAHIENKKHRFLVKSTFGLSIIIALFTLSGNPFLKKSYSASYQRPSDPYEQVWVDSVMQNMTLEERIGQLVMLRAHSDKDAAYVQMVEDQIKKYKVGGVCFFQGTPQAQAEITNRYQSQSRIPLMVAIDGEWGLGMRLKESISYPKQLTLGAIQENSLVYEMGNEVARQCKRIGIHVNFAPATDINNNPNNPVINDRSFGEDRHNVTVKSYLYALGLQDAGVLACAKHFPGHGDTDVDSHEDLPLISHQTERLDSLELFPFRVLFQHGVGSVMVAHLNVPAIDNRKNRPSSLSDRTINKLLRKGIGFDGLVFTDAMEMKGVTKYFKPGEADLAALKAGNDVILLPENVDACFEALYRAAKSGELSYDQINESVRRVLRAKFRCGLNRYEPVNLNGIYADLNNDRAIALKRKLYRNAITLVRDDQDLVPARSIDALKFGSLAFGAESITDFQKSLELYAPVSHFLAPKNIPISKQTLLLDSLRKYDVLYISLHGMKRKPADNFGLAPEQISMIHELAQNQQVVLTVFGNPYSLRNFDRIPTIVQAFEEDKHAQEVAAQALFGAADIKGKLPITASVAAKFAQGLDRILPEHRFAYDLPVTVGMDERILAQMDQLVDTMIRSGAAPGCQILVAKNGTVIWQKAYGYHDYSQTRPVSLNDLYDLASITKVASTTLATMRLDELGMIRTDTAMSTYVPGLLNTDKSHLRVDEMLAHHAGLKSWIPFYKNTLDKRGMPDARFYRSTPDDQFSVQVAPNLYMDRAYVDSLWLQIYTSELRSIKSYKYSDLGLYLAKQMVENTCQQPIDQYTKANFYAPLGAYRTQFNPWLNGSAFECVPSENDRYFRHCDLRGCVHDMGAAMLGGVSGHAGLFSNANDLAKIFQMLLNGGSYFNHKYLQESTIAKYTTRYKGSTRRGLGFDMKELNHAAQQNVGSLAPAGTFGHLGFTGTAVWADPTNDLIFIMLANRTYPSMDNNKFITEDYRPRIQDIVYRSLNGAAKAQP